MAENKYYKTVIKVLWIVLFLNWLVAILKLVFGYVIKSSSMIADGYHSFSDGASNVIGLIGISIASQPRDRAHPYGHKKFETFSSVGISILLFIICFNILHESLSRFNNSIIPAVNLSSFLVMLFTMAINFLVMNYEKNKGISLNSDFLIADSMHTRSDIFASISVIFAFIAIKSGFPIIDVIVAIIIALFIGKSAVDILRSSSGVLCDRAAMDTNIIRGIVLGIDGVLSCHKIRTRGRKDDIYVDLHIQVKPDMHVDRAHQISSKIEEEIKKHIPGVTDVVVHIEPR